MLEEVGAGRSDRRQARRLRAHGRARCEVSSCVRDSSALRPSCALELDELILLVANLGALN